MKHELVIGIAGGLIIGWLVHHYYKKYEEGTLGEAIYGGKHNLKLNVA